MGAPPEPQPISAFEAFKFCREEVKSEYNVLANRLSSYITSQSFLVSAYTIAMGNASPRFRLAFPILLSIVGVLLSVRAQPGIAGSCDVIVRFHRQQNTLLEEEPDLQRASILQLRRVSDLHEKNLLFAQGAVWIFGFAWVLLAALAIWLSVARG